MAVAPPGRYTRGVPTPDALPAVPAIYSPDPRAEPLNAWGRLLAASVALACLGLLATAALLPPSPTGVGTHEALGLAPCGFLRNQGVPCASCGMTTAFARYARLDVVGSAVAQPMGLVLAVLATAAVWVGGYAAVTANPVQVALGRLPLGKVVVGLVAFGVAAWGYKIAVVLAA